MSAAAGRRPAPRGSVSTVPEERTSGPTRTGATLTTAPRTRGATGARLTSARATSRGPRTSASAPYAPRRLTTVSQPTGRRGRGVTRSPTATRPPPATACVAGRPSGAVCRRDAYAVCSHSASPSFVGRPIGSQGCASLPDVGPREGFHWTPRGLSSLRFPFGGPRPNLTRSRVSSAPHLAPRNIGRHGKALKIAQMNLVREGSERVDGGLPTPSLLLRRRGPGS